MDDEIHDEPVKPTEYVCSTWFERDRQHIRLETADGSEIFSLWDDEVTEAIESGYLTQPRFPRPSDSDWKPHAIAYAIDMGLITSQGALPKLRNGKEVAA